MGIKENMLFDYMQGSNKRDFNSKIIDVWKEKYCEQQIWCKVICTDEMVVDEFTCTYSSNHSQNQPDVHNYIQHASF